MAGCGGWGLTLELLENLRQETRALWADRVDTSTPKINKMSEADAFPAFEVPGSRKSEL